MSNDTSSGEVTRLLHRLHAGDTGALERLYPLVYDEMRRVARQALARERASHTLQARAAILFADGVRQGIGGLAWLHASAHHELVLLQPVRGSLPVSLRTERGVAVRSVAVP
ncbi:MAG TPA: ECF-type sigma factor [Gemmatimonadaceae bacterium]|nr:ECF-type sigma factor [Gemmatimonadaceae bacterium]